MCYLSTTVPQIDATTGKPYIVYQINSDGTFSVANQFRLPFEQVTKYKSSDFAAVDQALRGRKTTP
jgi:hypothetical protein